MFGENGIILIVGKNFLKSKTLTGPWIKWQIESWKNWEEIILDRSGINYKVPVFEKKQQNQISWWSKGRRGC